MATVTKGLVFRADLDNYDGTLTTSRTDSTGGTVSGLKIGNGVDVLSVFGAGDTANQTLATINTATDALGSTNIGLVFAPGTWTIDDDKTIASNFSVIIPAGCVFDIAAGKTLTLAGTVLREHATYSSGSGTLTISGTDVTGVAAGTFSGSVSITGTTTVGNTIKSDTDSTDDLGTTSVRFANVYTDSIGDSGQQLLIPASSIRTANTPAFLAYNSVTDSNVIGTSGTGTITVDYDTEVFDQGNNFASDVFTAPVDGRYLLIAQVRLGGVTAAADDTQIQFSTSNRTYTDFRSDTNDIAATTVLRISAIVDMDANDTASVLVQVRGEASDVVDVFGTTTPHTFFSGCMLA